MIEHWRPVIGFASYEVSSMGRTRRVGSGTILKPSFDRRGYASVVLCERNSPRRKMVNRLVCDAFNGPPPTDKYVAAHLDGNCQNNTPTNLEWKTTSANEADKRRHGTKLVGARHHQAKLSSADVAAIRQDAATGESPVSIARRYDIDRTHVWRIVRHKNWCGVEITDRAATLAFFADGQAMTEFLQTLAERAVRAGVEVPGTKVTESMVAA